MGKVDPTNGITDRKSKVPLKAGMTVSEANTDKVQKTQTLRKSVETDGWLQTENDEVIILKEINNVKKKQQAVNAEGDSLASADRRSYMLIF